MMRVFRTAAVALAIVTIPFAAVAEEYPHKAVNLSLFYPVATSQDPTISTSFRLNLTYSHVGEVRGFDLNGLVSRVDRDMGYLQFTGLVSYVGGNMNALQFTGGVNYVGGDTKGAQITGLVNYSRGELDGIQYAFLMNYTEKGFEGIQISSVMNMNNGDGEFLQVGTIANINGANFTGVQLGTGINFVNDELKGVQLGLLNFTTEFRGVQFGGFNATRNANGPQIGVLNLARENNSVPVGLMSFADNSNTDWVSYASSYVAFNSGVRTAVRGWYSMLTAGVGDITADRDGDDTMFFGWNYGYAFGLGESEKWSIAPDVGYMHIMPQPSATENDKQQFGLQARLLAEIRFNHNLAIFAGGGVVTRWAEYRTDADTKTDGFGLIGISAF